MTQRVLVVNLNGPYIVEVQEFSVTKTAQQEGHMSVDVDLRLDGAKHVLYPGQYKEITIWDGKSFEVKEVGPVNK